VTEGIVITVLEVVADRMPADPVVGRKADHVRNRRKAQDQEVIQDQGVAQDQGADPDPEAGVTVDIS
jgi:hypothetical protein